jgi:hypothetical protein
MSPMQTRPGRNIESLLGVRITKHRHDGSHKSVYEAIRRRDETPCAVAVQASTSSVVREEAALARLGQSHPNILHTFGRSFIGQRCYSIMELADCDLHDHMAAHLLRNPGSGLPEPTVRDYTQQARTAPASHAPDRKPYDACL